MLAGIDDIDRDGVQVEFSRFRHNILTADA